MDTATEQAANEAPASAEWGPIAPERHSASESADLQRYVRRMLLKAVVVLVLLATGLAFIGKYYAAELMQATAWVNEQVGFAGLAAILLITDSVISPVPPDLLLLVIANTDLAAHWWLYVPALGAISSIAGVIAWYLSSRLGETRLVHLLLGRFRERNAALVSRYGVLAVALGALTPVPYSLTCWTAGILHMPLKKFAWITLLRIPRFVAYYIVIAWSTHLLD